MDKATMRNLKEFTNMLYRGDEHEDPDRAQRSRDGGDDRVVPTLCSTCSYLAANYGTSTERGELGSSVVVTWRKHVDRFHPENEALSKSIATLEGIIAKYDH